MTGLPSMFGRAAARALLALCLALPAALLPAGAARAQSADPGPPWDTAESAHFRIHYRASQRPQAEAVVRAAERAWPRVTQALAWEPKSRIDIAVYSELDISNGFSTPLPFNLIGVFLTPPDEGQLLDNSAWLDLLLVHELTHAVHLDKRRGAPRVLQNIFGRIAWFVPNVFSPGWFLEGLAVWEESDRDQAGRGRGRLKGPTFEAWLRAERKRGFLKLAELNADGRALPLAKQYLYGAYFFEFIHRRYGPTKTQEMVEQHSGDIGFAPRLHSMPWGATGKMMDVLWDEFLADLNEQVAARAAPIERVPEATGRRWLGPIFEVPSLASLPDGAVLAVVDDGLGAPRIERLRRDGAGAGGIVRERVTTVLGGARLEAAADGSVLVMQPDLCRTRYLGYDVYRLQGSSLRQLTHCAHLRRAVQLGATLSSSGGVVATTRPTGELVAIQLDAGRTRLVRLNPDARSQPPAVLYAPPEGTDIIDIALAPDGRTLHAVTRREGDWQVIEFDTAAATPQPQPRLRLVHDAPIANLRHGPAGLEMVAVEGGVPNVWRLARNGAWQRLTHSHTAVVAQGGGAPDGSLAVVVIAAQGYELRFMETAPPLQERVAATRAASGAAAPGAAGGTGSAAGAVSAAGTTAAAADLGPARPYAAWRTMYPRSWFPAITSDRGLTAYGASTSGADAVGWHAYTATLQYETSQKEWLGGVEYVFRGHTGLALDRKLVARAWTGDSGDETTTQYDRELQAQWLSLFPVPGLNSLAHRVSLGIGAALDRIERVAVAGGTADRRQDERIAALVADYDSRGANWYSDGANRGLKLTLRGESYKPFEGRGNDTAPDYDGLVVRADARAYFGIGRGVLALRLTEARARQRTRPFQLGGATETGRAIGFALNNREIALRGYRGDEPELRGQQARLASVEWRMPLVDIDRHGMVPALGINRLAATVFYDIGAAWAAGRNNPDDYRRGVGLELRGEAKLLYALAIDLRLGVGHALDPIPGRGRTRGYLTVGQAF
ncbi:MAG: hypothetical protein HZC37_11810 [Burkholderiales bacterium]|nr:hypothetical protein [Burkholderiales bacterium]